MGILNSIFFPWKDFDTAGKMMYLSISVFYLTLMVATIISCSKKIRYLSFLCYFTYAFLFSFNIMAFFITFWYIALPLIFIVNFFTYRSVKKGTLKTRKQELEEGGWCCNAKHRKKQMEESENLNDKRQLDYIKNHPKKLNLYIIVLLSLLVPILIILSLWLLHVGYLFSPL